jgi:CSLREA domain-containing protein
MKGTARMSIIIHRRVFLKIATLLLIAVLIPTVVLGIELTLTRRLPTVVQADTTIYVNTTDDELNSDGDCSLREAIRAANSDTTVDACPAGSGADTIILPAGVYTLTISGIVEEAAATGDLDITDDLTLIGAGASTTTIDGGGLDRVFHIAPFGVDITVEMSGMTIRNGQAPGGGGGIWNDGLLTIADCAVTGNGASDEAGGIWNEGTLTVTSSTISNNSATHGGGLKNRVHATMVITNSTISGNSASDSAGGIINSATLTLINSTIVSNTAGSYYGGIGNFTSGADLRFKNTIIAGNSPQDCGGNWELISLGHNLIQNTSMCSIIGTVDDIASDITGRDTRLGSLQDNGGETQTHALLLGSPAVDAGTNDGCPTTDQRGEARPVDGDHIGAATCDIGAYEVQEGWYTLLLPIILRNY